LVALVIAGRGRDTAPRETVGTLRLAPLPPPVVGHAPPQQPLPRRAQLGRARRAGRHFLRGYVRFLYGHGPASRVVNITARIRASLTRGQSRPSPAHRHRRPAVVRLRVVAQSARTVIATADVDDHSVARYALTFARVRRGRRWLVNELGRD
jgi:hypothetical protein